MSNIKCVEIAVFFWVITSLAILGKSDPVAIVIPGIATLAFLALAFWDQIGRIRIRHRPPQKSGKEFNKDWESMSDGTIER